MSRIFFYLFLFIILISTGLSQNVEPLSQNELNEINNLEKQIVIYKNNNDLNLAASSLNKLGYIYWNHNNYHKALDNFKKSAQINEQLGNENGCKILYNNIAILSSDINKCEDAVTYFKKVYNLIKSKPKNKNQVNAIINISVAFTECNKPTVAIEYLQKGLLIAQELNNIYLLRNIYGQLADNYEKSGDAEKSFEYFGLFSTFDQHVRNKEQETKDKKSRQQLDNMANRTRRAEEIAQYNEEELAKSIVELKRTTDSLQMVEQISEQRKLKLVAQEAALKEKEARLKLAAQFRNTIIVGFILLLGFTIMVFWLYLQKRKINVLLANQNTQLQNQKDEILHQKYELEKVNLQLNLKNMQIMDSISYAKRIQEAILPFEKSLNEKLPESFIFYLPRDIVSGDFYWFSEQQNKLFIAAVDCTGHGVPGAFMSMIGNTLLNEIINEKKFIRPSRILKKLNEGVIHILNQGKDRKDVQDDGMDVSLCAIDLEKKVINLACANQDALLFQDGKYKEISGDIYTIGGIFSLKKEDEFTNHQIQITQGTTLYMLSDGFQDQFGGEDNKKFMTNKLKKLLESIQGNSMQEQQNILQETLDTWKGGNKQIDDILIIGIRF